MRYAAKGAWNCHQFHANSEFFSNHSLYNVKITVPKEYVVGTGGMQMAESDSDTEGKNKTLTYRAEDIVDFAWTAWPGYAVLTDKWQHIKITLLIPKDRIEQVERQFTAVKHAMEYYAKYVGPYPWPYLTIVDPPAKGARAGGMEYTTLFTSSSSYLVPAFIHFPEMVTIHEFGHAYFMGILASNEFEEPWLDEGVNSFWEERIVDHYYGENSGLINHPFLKIADKSLGRLSYVHSEGRQDVTNNEYSWNYPHSTYGMMSYDKTATWLYTLMGIIGEETTDEVFREYYKKWAFKHPSGKDFVNVVNEVVTRINGNKFGPDMNWFFEQTLYGTGLCDYKVTNIYNKKLETLKESLSDSDPINKNLLSMDRQYKSAVELERAGEVMLPVEVLVHFKNGDELLESWDGKSRFKDFSYTGTREIEWVKIDPEFKIRMDVNYINNSMTLNPDRVPLRRLTNKLMSFMQFFINSISL
jgi:aminopeptidase N